MDTLNLRVLAVSSAIAGEGKTLTAINLAANMASTGRKKVLLVDMDLRKSSIAKELGMASDSGAERIICRGPFPRRRLSGIPWCRDYRSSSAGKRSRPPRTCSPGKDSGLFFGNCGGSSISWFWTLPPFCPFPMP